MEYVEIGNVLRSARKRHGLTQEELSFGICAVSTLSRIENGVHVPRTRTFEALMQRMGEPEQCYLAYEGKWKLERRKLLQKMEQLLFLQKENEVEDLLNQYHEIPETEDLLEKQERMIIDAALLFSKKVPSETICRKLKDALELTRPNAFFYCYEREHCSENEKSILNMLGFVENTLPHINRQ